MHQKCCKVMKYEEFKAGEIILESGELAKKFFVIIDGNVNLFLPKSKEQIKYEISERS